MKVLVAGSSGFIGSHLTQLLADEGHEVIGFDLVEPATERGVARFIQGDIRKKEEVAAALDGIDVMINLAAIHFDFGHEEDEYWATNEGGTAAVLEALSDSGVSRLIFTSSIAVYGDRSDEANELTTPNPSSPYGASKLAAEELIREWAEADPARSAVILRPCVVFGERNITNMRNLIRQIDSGFFILFGSGKNVKATAYVGNLIRAIDMHLTRLEPGLIVRNYADKPDMTVSQIVSVIRQALGKSPKPLQMPVWLGVMASIPFEVVAKLTGKNFPVSIARVKKLAQPTQVAAQQIRDAGFEQTITSDEGLRRMVQEFRETKQAAQGTGQ